MKTLSSFQFTIMWFGTYFGLSVIKTLIKLWFALRASIFSSRCRDNTCHIQCISYWFWRTRNRSRGQDAGVQCGHAYRKLIKISCQCYCLSWDEDFHLYLGILYINFCNLFLCQALHSHYLCTALEYLNEICLISLFLLKFKNTFSAKFYVPR